MVYLIWSEKEGFSWTCMSCNVCMQQGSSLRACTRCTRCVERCYNTPILESLICDLMIRNIPDQWGNENHALLSCIKMFSILVSLYHIISDLRFPKIPYLDRLLVFILLVVLGCFFPWSFISPLSFPPPALLLIVLAIDNDCSPLVASWLLVSSHWSSCLPQPLCKFRVCALKHENKQCKTSCSLISTCMSWYNIIHIREREGCTGGVGLHSFFSMFPVA